jgi:hypothetical protein
MALRPPYRRALFLPFAPLREHFSLLAASVRASSCASQHVPHQPVNLSDTEPARAIVARNDPNEQEHVIPYDPAADGQ